MRIWARRLGAIAAVGLLGVVLVTGLAFAQANPATETGTTTIGFALTSPCTGENVWIEGEFHYVSHITWSADANAFVHVYRFSSASARGTGLVSGNTYRVISSTILREDFQIKGEGTFVWRTRLFGPQDEFVFRATSHYTTDTNGLVRMSVSRLESECLS
jgi:hypothetical protein